MGRSAAAIDVGSVIADTYTIEALLGRGGMGSVFLASHNRLPGKKVAIKLLHAELVEGDEVLARFRREAEIASRLNHPNIVTVHDFNVTPDNTPYLILEYLEGDALSQRMRERQLPLPEILTIVRQVGAALTAAHSEGIVHRDLKPQNIFLVATQRDGHAVDVAKVLDFGISKIRGSQTVKTQESMLLGTPQYMAPEQAKGEHARVDERTDVFALGSIVYEMLAGVPAFSGASIPEVCFKVVYEQATPLAERVPGLPPHVTAAIERAMAKQPDERFPTVSAFVEALTGAPVSIMRVPSRPPVDDKAPSSPSGKIRSSAAAERGAEAFDQTIGPEVTPSAQPRVSAQARTVMSDGAIAPPAEPTRAMAPAEPAGRSRALVIALALLALAAIGVAAFALLRGPGDQVVASADAAAASPDATAIAVAPPADAAITSADAAVALAPPADATLAPSDARVAADAARARPPEADDGDPEIATWVRGAEAAYAARDYDRAEQLASDVFASPNARPRQRARALAIEGQLWCVKRNNAERARIIARQLAGPLRRKVLVTCKQAGFPILGVD